MKAIYFMIGIVLSVAPACAQPSKQNASAAAPSLYGDRIATTHLSLTLDSSKVHLCFWEGSAYSPGSLVNFLDASKSTNICFHCNADGTWDKPCQ